MEELIDLIVTDSSPSTVSDHMKNIMFAKAAERIEVMRPEVAAAMFGDSFSSDEFDEQDVVDSGNQEDYEEQ
jgi:hypothetical protein